MNEVILIGRLAADPDLKTTMNGKIVTSFTLAVDSNKSIADFIYCTAFDKTAESIAKYKTKGDQIAVAGSIRVDKYKNQNGADSWKTYIAVNRVKFVGSRTSNETAAEPEVTDDDLPF